MAGNTGTYLDSPFHRYAEGDDLASLPLASLADMPTVVVAAHGHRAMTPELLDQRLTSISIDGCAVLLRTGATPSFGTPAYAEQAPS